MRALPLVVLLSSLALPGCSADSAPGPGPSPVRSTVGPPAGGTGPATPDPKLVPTPKASDPAATGPTGGSPPGVASPGTGSAPAPFTGSTAAQVREPTGGPLGVKVARVGRQQGYDRVVVELAGRAGGAPGWRVEYVTTPTSDGSGNPIAMKGKYFLLVAVQGVGYPDDTGVPNPAVRRFAPSDTAVVAEYVLDSVFEGTYTTYVGLTAKVPYRVSALSDPTRIVIDLRHP